jgi:hypothetical protein
MLDSWVAGATALLTGDTTNSTSGPLYSSSAHKLRSESSAHGTLHPFVHCTLSVLCFLYNSF